MIIANSRNRLFLPNQLDKQGLFLWGDDPNNNFVKPTSSASISSWKDKFSTSNNATQATAAKQPLYILNSSTQNANRSSLFFDGVNYTLTSSLNIDYSVNPNIMIYCLYYLLSTTATDQALYGQDNGGFDRFVLLAHPTLGPCISNGSTGVSVPALGNTATWQLLTVQLQNGVTNGSQVWINGTSQATFTESHSNSGLSTTNIASIDGSTQFANVYIACFLVYLRVHTAQERKLVQQFIARAYGQSYSP